MDIEFTVDRHNVKMWRAGNSPYCHLNFEYAGGEKSLTFRTKKPLDPVVQATEIVREMLKSEPLDAVKNESDKRY